MSVSTFYLENGQGKVTLDTLKAFEHVRHVLNDIHRAYAAEGASKENDNPIVWIPFNFSTIKTVF